MSRRSGRSGPSISITSRDGSRILALPGMYKYTKFRSQLEIQFAQELDSRGIRWFYEPERLGEGRYLVDFYLPDFKSWVEVKGRVTSRDHLVLREVAEMLSAERHHRVFMYMCSKVYLVTSADFKPLTHELFWRVLAAPQPGKA
jgi:hypothetical protein